MCNEYSGMTVNERLYMSGLINEFDKAVLDKDINKIKSILTEIQLSDSAIEKIIESLKL